MDCIHKYAGEHVDNRFLINEHPNTPNRIRVEESKNLGTSKLYEVNIVVPKKWVYFEDYIVICFDENNINFSSKLFPYFKRTIISSVDAILIHFNQNKNRIDIYHIELKSDNYQTKDIFRKYTHSVNCAHFILKSIELNLCLKQQKYNYEKIEHRVLVFSTRHSSDSRKYGEYGDQYKHINNNFDEAHKKMLFQGVRCKNKDSYLLSRFLIKD